MALLNPQRAPLTTLTFTRLTAVGSTTDDLGNPIATSAPVTVQAIVTPLTPARLSDLVQSLNLAGVDGEIEAARIRVEAWPPALAKGKATARLVYRGRPATAHLLVRDGNLPAQRVAKGLGVSAEGVLVYG
jgi:hypothetical protein